MTTILINIAIFAVAFALGFFLRRVTLEQMAFREAVKKYQEAIKVKYQEAGFTPPPVANSNEFPTKVEMKAESDRLSQKAALICHDVRCEARFKKWHKCHMLDCKTHFPKVLK